MEVINPVTQTELKPFMYLALNFIVGSLVAKGYVDGASKDVIINDAANALGLLMLAATSVVTLYRVIKHPHTPPTLTKSVTVTTKESEATPPAPVVLPVSTPIVTQLPDSGTPSQTEQITSTNGVTG